MHERNGQKCAMEMQLFVTMDKNMLFLRMQTVIVFALIQIICCANVKGLTAMLFNDNHNIYNSKRKIRNKKLRKRWQTSINEILF